jgi:hypothetical protein
MRTAVFVAVLACSAAAVTPPKAIVLMLGDDYGYNNVSKNVAPDLLGSSWKYPSFLVSDRTSTSKNELFSSSNNRTPNMDALVADGIVLVFKWKSIV